MQFLVILGYYYHILAFWDILNLFSKFWIFKGVPHPSWEVWGLNICCRCLLSSLNSILIRSTAFYLILVCCCTSVWTTSWYLLDFPYLIWDGALTIIIVFTVFRYILIIYLTCLFISYRYLNCLLCYPSLIVFCCSLSILQENNRLCLVIAQVCLSHANILLICSPLTSPGIS